MNYILLIFISLFIMTGCVNILDKPEPKKEPVVKVQNIIKTTKKTETQIKRKFLIYFQIDSVFIQDQSNDVLIDALLTAKRNNIKNIEIIGHSDKSGNKAYNEKLSLERAESIAGYFAVNGIEKSKMIVYSLGESHPLVETEDGETNDLNRRVEIILN